MFTGKTYIRNVMRETQSDNGENKTMVINQSIDPVTPAPCPLQSSHLTIVIDSMAFYGRTVTELQANNKFTVLGTATVRFFVCTYIVQ